jgi:hypothetical protein
MDASLTLIQRYLRRLEQLVSSEGVAADDLRVVELGLTDVRSAVHSVNDLRQSNFCGLICGLNG